jgi:hypothetical protein
VRRRSGCEERLRRRRKPLLPVLAVFKRECNEVVDGKCEGTDCAYYFKDGNVRGEKDVLACAD